MPTCKVCKLNEIIEGKVISKLTPYGPIGLTKLNGKVIAFQDECTHDGSPFDDAKIDLLTREIICPRHGARFNLDTGKVTKLPATEDIEIYQVEIINDEVYVNMD
jgi:3-phenylpropionate/trans-cinnamate dioxygenase ferredoxin subunit